jgi:hypothetical protein
MISSPASTAPPRSCARWSRRCRGASTPTREEVERGLAKLVLTVIELLRRLLEKQAIRRIDSGNLTDEEIERLGVTFLRLNQRMKELQGAFGLQDEDLNLNLGPLGDLM